MLAVLLRPRLRRCCQKAPVHGRQHVCVQIMQHTTSSRGSELLQHTAHHCMHEILQAVFARLPDIRDVADADNLSLRLRRSGLGACCMVDVFNFLCPAGQLHGYMSPQSEGCHRGSHKN